MNPARFERDIARARIRYARAAHRFGPALADWQAAAVPIVMTDETVPLWTPRQRDVTSRAVKAWDNLLVSHQGWESLLHGLGHQR